MADLEKQIEKEAGELKSAPAVPILGAIVGRCHLCGQIVDVNELEPFDTHVQHGVERKAASCCHPHRHVLPAFVKRAFHAR